MWSFDLEFWNLLVIHAYLNDQSLLWLLFLAFFSSVSLDWLPNDWFPNYNTYCKIWIMSLDFKVLFCFKTQKCDANLELCPLILQTSNHNPSSIIFKDWSRHFSLGIKCHRSCVNLVKHEALLKDLRVAHGILFLNENKKFVLFYSYIKAQPNQ